MDHPTNIQDPHISSLSEFDSLSDSDWLDIARESDTESLSSRDSDRLEVVSSSLSRRSSFSTSSSRDGEVEAWEGFVEDGADGSTPLVDPDQTLLTVEPGQSSGPSSGPAIEDRSVEDRLVKDGLDQSVISTLSASRSSSHLSTTQNSLRDLRLSFPDPLTSSRNELNSSYDAVSATDTNIPNSNDDDDGTSLPAAMSDSMSSQDLGSLPTPVVHAQDTSAIQHPPTVEVHSDFEIVLYGRSSLIKWTFVHDLLRKTGLGNEHSLNNTGKSLLDCDFDGSIQYIDNIPVIDKTYGSSFMPCSGTSLNRPSLAVVYLPSSPSLLAEHTCYLPVITPSSDRKFDEVFEEARVAWSTFSVPANRVLRLEGSSSSSMFAAEDVDKLDPVLARKAFRQLFTPLKASYWAGLFEQFNAAHAVTIFALLCLVAGFSVNTAFRVQPSKGNGIIPLIAPSRVSLGPVSPYNSSALSIRATTSLSTVPVPLPPAARSRGSSSVPSPSTSFIPIAASSSRQDVQSITTEPRLVMKAMKDLMIRPTSEVQYTTQACSSSETASAIITPEQTHSSAVSPRLVNSLSEIIEVSIKALVEVVSHDLNDLIIAIDELMRAINRQTRLVVEQSKSTVQVVREQIEYRHNRAKGKARELKEMGTQLMSHASDKFLGRTEVAKKRAHMLKDKVTSSTAWNHYSKAHGEWSSRLQNDRRGGDRTIKTET